MDIICTDKNGVEQGYLTKSSIDIDLGNTNDFEITTALTNNVLDHNSIIYIDGTELGGIVKRVVPDTTSETLKYGGYTWRGILNKKIIEPSTGNDYHIETGTFKDITTRLITKCDLSDLFVVDADSPTLSFVSYQFNRYCTLLSGLNAMLKSKGYKLVLRFTDKVIVSCAPIADYSDQYEISKDMKLTCKIEIRTDFVNHMICLGKGELKARQVAHLYVDQYGSIGTNKFFTGKDEITETYDYSGVESLEELISQGKEELENRRKQSAMDVNVDSNINLDLGDIVTGIERITNTQIKREISNKIVNIEGRNVLISYKVGDK